MSRTSLHDSLESFFNFPSTKKNIDEFLEHQDLKEFCSLHGLTIPLPLFAQALTHRSFSHEFSVPDQEQLEFLGDAVLELILTEELFEKFPDAKEGHLSKLRSAIVNEASLSLIARGLGLHRLILVGKGEYKKLLMHQEGVQADTLEAVLALIYRFHGFEFCKMIFLSWLKKFIPSAFEENFLKDFDAKSRLQEKVMAKYKELPAYHAKSEGSEFRVELMINKKVVASGLFSSKKKGEKELATSVLKKGLI